MSKYDQWLESPYYDSNEEKAEELICERVAELLHTEYSPHEWHNIQYALFEECLNKYQENIQSCLVSSDTSKLGNYFKTAIFEFWEARAIEKANNEYNNGSLE